MFFLVLFWFVEGLGNAHTRRRRDALIVQLSDKEKLELFLEKKDVNYDAIISFLSKKTGVSDVTSMDIYHIDNECDKMSTGDAIDIMMILVDILMMMKYLLL